jgi:TonB-dependent receptor
LDYVLPHGKIVLQNTLAHTVNDLTAYRYYLDFAANALTYTLNRDKNNRELLINALQTEYNFGTVKAEFTLSHSYSDKNTDIRYGDAGDNFGFINQTEHHPFGVDANGNPISYAGVRQNLTPDDVYKIQIDPTDSRDAAISNWATTRSEAFKQHLYNSTLDFTVPVSFTEDFSAKFKVGGKFSRSTRMNDLEEKYSRTDAAFYNADSTFLPNKILNKDNPLLLSDIQNNNFTRGQYFLNNTYNMKYVIDVNQMDKFLPLSTMGWVPGRHMTNSERYDFNGAEIFSAGYLMGDFSIGSRLTILGGARFEHYNMNYKANFVYATHSVDGLGMVYDTLNTVDRNDDNVLPNVQLRYKFTDWADLRLAYTNSLSRPDYQAIMPNVYFEPGNLGQAGNSKLKPTFSKNYDVSLSFYNNEIGLFTVGGFYKNLDNVFYQTNIYYGNLSYYNVSFPDSAAWKSLGVHAPNASDQIQTFVNNPHPAHIKGLEFEWQTNFWYLPKPLNALVLNINYTRVWSDMDYQQLRNIDSAYQSGRFTLHKYFIIDTLRNARLLYQGDNILNIALGVDYKGFSGRVSFNLQGNVITTVGSRPELDQFTGNIYKWDLMLQQKLPIEGLSIAFNVENLTHSPTYTYQHFRRSANGPIVDNLASTLYGPRNFELNLRYSI